MAVAPQEFIGYQKSLDVGLALPGFGQGGGRHRGCQQAAYPSPLLLCYQPCRPTFLWSRGCPPETRALQGRRCLFPTRTCQILCMMLRKFNFPTVALHSMMKQVRGQAAPRPPRPRLCPEAPSQPKPRSPPKPRPSLGAFVQALPSAWNNSRHPSASVWPSPG